MSIYVTSAFERTTDMHQSIRDVCFWPEADTGGAEVGLAHQVLEIILG
jgi:hypothetical protein